MHKTFQRFIIIYLLFISSAFATFPSSSTIQTIKSMEEIENYIDKDTLVLFDLDHTVFETKNYGYGHANWVYDQIEIGKAKGVDEKTTIAKIFPHWLVSEESSEVKPVEALTPKLIKKLQNNGVQMIGLTARQVPLANITINHLRSIDVDFKADYLPREVIGSTFSASTLMKDGVIFCSEYNDKGEVLHAYLDKLDIKPHKILFIDDSLRNLKSVMKAYSKEAVVVGLHYPLVEEYKKQHWDATSAHLAYYKVSLEHPELQKYPLTPY